MRKEKEREKQGKGEGKKKAGEGKKRGGKEKDIEKNRLRIDHHVHNDITCIKLNLSDTLFRETIMQFGPSTAATPSSEGHDVQFFCDIRWCNIPGMVICKERFDVAFTSAV